MRTEFDEDIEVNIDTVGDGDDWVADKNWKQCSTKPDRNENCKRVCGSIKADSDHDNFETGNESRSKLGKKKLEVNTLDVLSTWYQDGESDNKLDGGEKPGSVGYSRVYESERKNPTLQSAEHGTNVELVAVRDTMDLSRRDNGREKGYGYAEHRRNHKRRWDEPDEVGRTPEPAEKIGTRVGDHTLESSSEREITDVLENNLTDTKGREFELINDKGMKSREDRRVDSDRVKRGRSEFSETDSKGSLMHEESKERFDEHKKNRIPNRDMADAYGRSSNADEYPSTYVRGKSRKDVENSNMSRTPEKVGRSPTQADNLEVELERSSNSRRKELGKDSSWDERSKPRDDSWVERNKEREYMKDNWKRKQDFTTKDGETTYDNVREWDMPRRGRDRIDGRSGGRKDGIRTEAVKTSSKYGISNENYDVIEIQTKPFDYAREDSKSILVINGKAIPSLSEKQDPDAQELSYPREQSRNAQESTQSGEDGKDSSTDGDLGLQERPSWIDDTDLQSENFRGQKVSRSSVGGPVSPLGHQESGSYGGAASQGARMNRMGRGGRVRPTVREGQQSGMPLPLVGSPFGPLGLPPPGPMQTLPPNMSPAPGPISPNVFMPPFQPPMMWSGARGIEMNMLGVRPGLPPIPPGPLGPRFSLTLGNGASGALAFNQYGRGMSPSMTGPNFNTVSPLVRGDSQDKVSGGWPPPRINAPPGKAPSRGEQNDYSQNFVDTGMRPQNFIRELEHTNVVEDYPKLRELISKKDKIVEDSNSHPMFHKCDLREQVLSPEFFGTKFDVILVDPPWEEYVHRAPGVTDHMEHWTFEEIMNLKIEAIADTPSFIFLWVGDGLGLEQGRLCLKKWGFRRCEDICWVKTNKENATPGSRHDSHTLFQHSKEHCLMGIKGTVRRSTDGHIIHANIDTDVIIAEEPPYGSTAKPEDMYKIIEHFALGRRRLELFGEDHNIRNGWLTVGKGLSSSNFNSEGYVKNFSDKDGKVWIGGGGRNPPPEAPHLVVTTPDIESLRPKSPMKNQQQQQQQSSSISLTPANTNNKRPTENSPFSHPNTSNLIQEGPSSNIPSPAPWISPVDAFRGREVGGHIHSSDDRMFDMYGGYNAPFVQATGEFLDYESHRE